MTAAEQYQAARPTGVKPFKVDSESTAPEPGEFHREWLGVFVGPEATEKRKIPKSGSNALRRDSRGASPVSAPSPDFAAKRAHRPLQRDARPASGRGGAA